MGDPGFYRASTTFDAKDDAIAWLSARRAEIQMEVWAPDVATRGARRRESPTFRAYADLWLENRKTKGRELRPTTRRQYRMLLDKFILPTFGDQRIDRITNEDVNAWYDELAPGRETIRAQSYSLLRTIFASAASERPTPFIPYNPAHIRGAGDTKRAHQVQPATLAELETIVAELPDRYQLMALLAAWCAMRFGELTELRHGDIDPRTNRVKIRRGVVRVDGEFIVGPPKSDAGSRDVAIPPHLLPMVKDHLSRHTTSGKDALLFPAAADGNHHMAPSTLYKVYYPARKAAGRPDLRWHDLASQPGPSSPRRPARPSPSSWGASVTPRRVRPCATSTPPLTGDTEIARRLSALVEPSDADARLHGVTRDRREDTDHPSSTSATLIV